MKALIHTLALALLLLLLPRPAGAQTYESVFAINPSPFGFNPTGRLCLGSDGNFYGTTLEGNSGVFKITPTGQISALALRAQRMCYLFKSHSGRSPTLPIKRQPLSRSWTASGPTRYDFMLVNCFRTTLVIVT